MSEANMTDDPIVETAKAVQAVAKTTDAGIELLRDMGPFLGKMLGDVPENLVDWAGGSWLRRKRLENLDKTFRRAEELFADRDIKEPDPINLKHTQPLFAAVSEEDDETLKEM